MTGSRIDLSPWRPASELIDALWAVRRSGRKELEAEVLRLLHHEDPIVREEAISLLFVKWQAASQRDRLVDALRSDSDFGVRSRAAWALALTCDSNTRQSDCGILCSIVLNREEDAEVRKACYEALHRVVRREDVMLEDDLDIDEDIDLKWVTDFCQSNDSDASDGNSDLGEG